MTEEWVTSKTKNRFKIFMYIVCIILILTSLTGATYAWFSASDVLGDYKAQVRSGSEDYKLEISKKGGASFKDENVPSIVQVNKSDSLVLMPVSTADLETFLYSPSTTDSIADKFAVVENEQYFYHGRIYIKATYSGNQADAGNMNIYLEETKDSGGLLAKNTNGELLGAARLGLKFGKDNPVIMSLSKDHLDGNEQAHNTSIDGKIIGDGNVLTYSNKKVGFAKDPSVIYTDYVIKDNGSSISIPDKPIANIKMNEIIPVDIYFYIEGCDQDCSNAISYDMADLHLAFFGMVNQK